MELNRSYSQLEKELIAKRWMLLTQGEKSILLGGG